MATVDPETTGRRKIIYLIGHSYIRRLGQFMKLRTNLCNFNLDVDEYGIYVSAKGGLTTSKLPGMLDLVPKPDLCFLQIGGNDIGKLSNDKIIRNIMAISRYLTIGMGVKKVVIGQLLRRRPDVVNNTYNDSVVEINIKLEDITHECQEIVFWKHRGFWKDLSHLGRDGIHLADPKHRKAGDPPSPMFKYWRSIRNAILVHSKHKRNAKAEEKSIGLSTGNTTRPKQAQKQKCQSKGSVRAKKQ